ncbi:plasmid pRiA4b ORF-3 family protein [Caldisalinibacter kiritimatiensis]|uniref:TnpR protein n=1 Tax=Caldisalinibacter kiritimatiensis TaxID=1304284 RepID=R1CCK5_9FIRM|nr:plasmid pRiA4b ORF-3 family protein [Caldisalinibacter kiritimatiensis]EOC99999.1 TnpR protein [Caldisalinibacter kiritimatiensis]
MYEFGYPICIEGEGACPPEDVGGIGGYEEFLEVINDPNHEDYEGFLTWAKEQGYKESWDIKWTNTLMKQCLKLKKIKVDK